MINRAPSYCRLLPGPAVSRGVALHYSLGRGADTYKCGSHHFCRAGVDTGHHPTMWGEHGLWPEYSGLGRRHFRKLFEQQFINLDWKFCCWQCALRTGKWQHDWTFIHLSILPSSQPSSHVDHISYRLVWFCWWADDAWFRAVPIALVRRAPSSSSTYCWMVL